jgi:hypothetical protein
MRFGMLHDYASGNALRPATDAELVAAKFAEYFLESEVIGYDPTTDASFFVIGELTYDLATEIAAAHGIDLSHYCNTLDPACHCRRRRHHNPGDIECRSRFLHSPCPHDLAKLAAAIGAPVERIVA